MKIAFFASTQAISEDSALIEKIADTIQKLGYDIVDSIVLQTPDFVDTSDDITQLTLYKKLNEADMNVFEVSNPSVFMGLLIAKGLDLNKPCILLSKKEVGVFNVDTKYEDRISIVSYTDKSIKKVLLETLTMAREKRDKRFNFFISPKLLEFLETQSKKEGMTKSKLIRNLIVDHMQNRRG